VTIDEPDLYYARLVCNFTSNFGKYCNPAFDTLFQAQSQTFEVQKRAEITRQMEHLLLQDVPDDRRVLLEIGDGILEPGETMATDRGDHGVQFWQV
jgi:hypothetical protein